MHRPELPPFRPRLRPAPLSVWRRRWLIGSGAFGAALLGGPWWGVPAHAQGAGTQTMALTLTGRVGGAAAGGRVDFDMPALAALPQHSFSTRTPWFDRPRQFTGPLLRDVLAAAGAQGHTLRLRALNDYRIDIPFSDAQRYDVLLARLLDGQPMRVRDKGPLFVIYPFDHDPELRNVVFYSRSAWQLRAIEVL